MAKPVVEIILKATDQASKVFKATGKDAKSMGKDLLKVGAAFAGAAVAAGLASKAIFEFGKSGARVEQTGESFDLLTEKVGLSSDLLEQLQDASKDTISDMELMGSTSLLLAGTQGELATALGESTPRLLEIAKAAQKLNPALGDTTFLYDSLARGIKRASPLILDNLGLMISVGDANEKYAKSIGKAVDQLTVEEEKMALLNATLEAGDVLIQQVGGSTDSATDSFNRLETSLKNMSDAAKKKAAPALADVADAVNLFLTIDEQLAESLIEQERELRDSALTYQDYITELKLAAEASGFLIDQQGNLVEQNRSMLVPATEEVVVAQFAMNEELLRAIQLAEGVTDSWMHMSEAAPEVIESTTALGGAIAGLASSYDAAKTASSLFGDSISILSDDLMDAERMKLTLKLLTEDLTQAEIEELLTTQQQLERLTELNQAFEEGTAGKEEFYSIVADGVITEDELNEALGRTEDSAEDAVPPLDDLSESVGDVTLHAKAAAAKTNALADAIAKLESKEITITVNFAGGGGGGGAFGGFPAFTPGGGGRGGGGGGGGETFFPGDGDIGVESVTAPIIINNQFFDQGAAAIGMAEIERIGADQFNSFMGG